MAYRNLHFRSLASDIRTESYLGEDHLVIPCIALVGDEVVYGLNADGPEFIPADELEMSTLGWGDRPVLYDHPPASTSSACEPRTLEAMSFGRTFFPRFEDKKLKLEAWCNKRRAKEIGQEELLASAERGDMIELSIGAIISLIRQNGVSPSGKQFGAYWTGIQSDHLAIGLSGSQGACSLAMGCGANRVLRSAGTNARESDNFRTMRAMRGVDTMPAEKPIEKPVDQSKPKSLVQKILSHASRVFRSNIGDEGLSDMDLRSRLWDVLYSVEPAFIGIEDVYQDSKTVRYITHPSYPESKMYLWRRTYNVAEDESVTVNDDREKLDFAVNYTYLSGEQAADDHKPCGCQTVPSAQTMSANETEAGSSTEPKGDETMPDDKKTDTTPPAVPSTPPSDTPATEAPNGTPKVEPDPATPPSTPAPAVTSDQLKALLEEHPVVKHYRAQEAKEKSSLVERLAKKQSVLSKEQLEAKPIEELRTYGEFLGINASQPVVGDFSGRMMASAEDEPEIKPVPKPWTAALKKAKEQGAN